MIKEILKFNNIGTPNYFIELSRLVSEGVYSKDSIHDFFVNKRIDDREVFDGGVLVLEYIGFFELSADGTINIPAKYLHFLRNPKLLTEKIMQIFIIEWSKDASFNQIFNADTVSHDLDKSIIINNTGFRFAYAKLKQMLIDFEVMADHPYMENYFRITNRYKKFFDKKVIKDVKKRMLSLEEFQKLQNIRNQYGSDAETFVLNFEKQKFSGHDLIDAIERIALVDASAGYDISSLQGEESTQIDKFIEVKSYSGDLNFYWSRNEIETARREQDNYFLYLVNRDEINNENYKPMMIQNPYKNVFQHEDWQKDCQSWKFQ